MTDTAVQQPVSFEELKQVVIALIKENNAEFKQLLDDYRPKRVPKTQKKAKEKQVSFNGTPVKKERIPYSEMPFWKANPHLKPHVIEGKGGLSNEFWKALDSVHETFNDVTDQEWDKILDDLKNDH